MLKKKKKMLTKRQKEMLDFIVEFKRKNDYMPSYKEMADHFKTSTSSVYVMCSRLQEKGYLRLSRMPRRIEILKK